MSVAALAGRDTRRFLCPEPSLLFSFALLLLCKFQKNYLALPKRKKANQDHIRAPADREQMKPQNMLRRADCGSNLIDAWASGNAEQDQGLAELLYAERATCQERDHAHRTKSQILPSAILDLDVSKAPLCGEHLRLVAEGGPRDLQRDKTRMQQHVPPVFDLRLYLSSRPVEVRASQHE